MNYDLDLHIDVEKALSRLTNERDAKVLRLYFGLYNGPALTLEEIAEIMGLSRERIRQLKERGVRRLKWGSTGITDYEQGH